ncbi:hypothetical protein BZZ01_29975 [Nostocales cyanobacterium HT-58-2]|nr:hypothetical protein BZZ01_29975 [Nostocales cyanobacterium HT-58-2]
MIDFASSAKKLNLENSADNLKPRCKGAEPTQVSLCLEMRLSSHKKKEKFVMVRILSVTPEITPLHKALFPKQ